MGRNWGQAHIEFKGLQEEICNELESVQSVKSIFNKLRAAGRISVTYKAFCEHVKSYRESLKEPCSSSWGSARTEVIGQMGQIRVALNEGRPLKSIYEELKAEGRVSGSYIGFYKNVRKFCGSPSPDLSSASSATPSPQPSPLPSSTNSPGAVRARRNSVAPGPALPPERSGGKKTFEYGFTSLNELQYGPERKEAGDGPG